MRLTEWRGEHAAIVNHHENYIDKLAASEDTGLEPEEIEDRQDVCLWIPEDRFAEIINAEADGRLVLLPCKLGDTVYHIVTHSVDVTGYRMEWKLETTVEPTAFRIWMVDAIGKTIFLQREEAEAALAALKGKSYERT